MGLFLDVSDEGQRGSVKLRGQDVDIRGLSAKQIARLLVQHDGIQQYLDGKVLNLLQLIKMLPDAAAAAIAYGTGYDDDERSGGDKAKFKQASDKAAKLAAGEQYDMLLGIFDLTFGERLNPFVKGALANVRQRLTQDAEPTPTVEPVADPERGAPDLRHSNKSLKELKASLRSATTDAMFGITPPGNSPGMPS